MLRRLRDAGDDGPPARGLRGRAGACALFEAAACLLAAFDEDLVVRRTRLVLVEADGQGVVDPSEREVFRASVIVLIDERASVIVSIAVVGVHNDDMPVCELGCIGK